MAPTSSRPVCVEPVLIVKAAACLWPATGRMKTIDNRHCTCLVKLLTAFEHFNEAGWAVRYQPAPTPQLKFHEFNFQK